MKQNKIKIYFLILFVIIFIGIIIGSDRKILNLENNREYTFFSDNLNLNDPITLSGNASFLDGNVKLTNTVSGQIGGLFSANKINVKYGFDLYFCLNTNTPSKNGGDGFCIVLSKNDNKCKLGGGYLGARLTDSLELEIDMFKNTNEPQTPHLYLWKNGVNIIQNETGTVHLANNLVSSEDFYIWIEYSSFTHNMDVFISKNSEKPDVAIATYNVNIEEEIGNLYYVGITASTGEDYQNHLVKEFGWLIRECEHNNINYIDNGDDTHKEICDDCGKVINESMPHIFENNDFCDKCGAEKLKEIEIRYIDEVNGEKIAISEELKIHRGEQYQTKFKEVEGYELVEIPENEIGTMQEEKIIVIYKYRKISKVIVRYIDLNSGNEIEKVENEYREGDNYSAESKEISGYKLVEVQSNVNGVVGREDIEVEYGYKKISGGVEVKYIDEVTNEEIGEKEIIEGLEKDEYETEGKVIEGYEITVMPTNKVGEMTEEKITVIYRYRKLSKVIVKYIDLNSRNEIEKMEKEYKEGDSYTTEEKEISEYKLIDVPSNVNGIVGRKDIEVVYGYKKVSRGVIVKHIDKESGEIIKEEKIEGLVGEKYNTKKLELEKYNYIEAVGDLDGELIEESIEIVYYYDKKQAIVKVIYVDENRKEVYKEILDGKVGEEYKVELKDIENYKIVEIPDNIEGIYRIDETVVKIKVERLKAKVIINIVDEEGNIIEVIEKIGNKGEKYEIELPDIEGYYIDKEKIEFECGKEELINIGYKKIIMPNTSDINIFLYIFIFFVAIIGVIVEITFIKSKNK